VFVFLRYIAIHPAFRRPLMRFESFLEGGSISSKEESAGHRPTMVKSSIIWASWRACVKTSASPRALIPPPSKTLRCVVIRLGMGGTSGSSPGGLAVYHKIAGM
jgi:hypothetical protein